MRKFLSVAICLTVFLSISLSAQQQKPTQTKNSNTESPAKSVAQNGPKPDLDYVILMGGLDEVKRALKAGAELNKLDMFGNSPLMNAIFSGKMKIARFLVKSGANTNIRNKNGLTPLLVAIYTMGSVVDKLEYYILIQELLEHKADPNVKTMNQRTPMDIARTSFSSPDYRLLTILARYGAQ